MAAGTAYETILVEEAHDGQLIWLTLNRPSRRNAISEALREDLNNFLDTLPRNKKARVVILKGAGDGFCSGADIKLLTQGLDEYSISDQTRTSDIVLKIRNAPQVFIAAVHGAAAGAGMCFALACDVRLASQTMRMNCAFLFLGLGGAELGASFFLPRMVGSSLASEMMLTGRFVHAQRALATGLVSAVFETKDELYAAAEAMALEMLAAAPRALLMTKQAIVLNSEGVSLESAIRTEDRAQVCCIKDPECMRVGMKYALRFASKL